MPIRKSVTISLSPELLASGRYGNISEVMRSALRYLDEREQNFQAHRDTRAAAIMSAAATAVEGQGGVEA